MNLHPINNPMACSNKLNQILLLWKSNLKTYVTRKIREVYSKRGRVAAENEFLLKIMFFRILIKELLNNKKKINISKMTVV